MPVTWDVRVWKRISLCKNLYTSLFWNIGPWSKTIPMRDLEVNVWSVCWCRHRVAHHGYSGETDSSLVLGYAVESRNIVNIAALVLFPPFPKQAWCTWCTWVWGLWPGMTCCRVRKRSAGASVGAGRKNSPEHRASVLKGPRMGWDSWCEGNW